RWPGGDNLAFLHFHAEPASFLAGYVASLAVSVLSILWATRVLAKLSPRALLAGQTTSQTTLGRSRRRWSTIILITALAGTGGCVLAGLLVQGHEAQAGSF